MKLHEFLDKPTLYIDNSTASIAGHETDTFQVFGSSNTIHRITDSVKITAKYKQVAQDKAEALTNQYSAMVELSMLKDQCKALSLNFSKKRAQLRAMYKQQRKDANLDALKIVPTGRFETLTKN
jgi:hypothetical protein